MINNEKKTQRQQLMANRWQNSAVHGSTRNGSGAIVAAGGFGKTYMAVNFVMRPYLESKLNNGLRTIIVIVPREPLVKQWRDAIRAHIPEVRQSYIRVATVQELISQNRSLEHDLIVIDELHMFYEDEFMSWIDGTRVKFKHNLGMTATYNDPHGRHKKIEHLYPIIDKIPVKEAIDEGYISRFVEYNYALEMNDADTNRYVELSNEIVKQSEKFGEAGFTGMLKVLQGGTDSEGKFRPGISYAHMHARNQGWYPGCPPDIDNIWNPNKIIGYAKLGMNAVQVRKALIYENKTKIDAAVEILKKYPTLKTISFSESTTYAEHFAAYARQAGFETVVFHSQLTSRPMLDANGNIITYMSGEKKGQPRLFGLKQLKTFAIDSIKSGRARVISTASALDVGFDVEDMELGIISSRNSNFNKQKQRTFRVTRVDPYKPDAVVLVINLYFPRTIDESALKQAQRFSESRIFWINDIEEIEFNPKEGFEL